MREFAGKTAFVTGGAAGIGLALGRAFAQSGMKVMLADIEADALQAAGKSLQEISPDIGGTICDVADAASFERAAQASFDAFGRVHVVCNNAGVAAGGGIDHISLDNWRWVIDVNLMGVLHGIKSFLPHIRAHGEGGHIVNTASMAGMQGGLGFSPYGASKFAVVSMSEGLSLQLKPHGRLCELAADIEREVEAALLAGGHLCQFEPAFIDGHRQVNCLAFGGTGKIPDRYQRQQATGGD